MKAPFKTVCVLLLFLALAPVAEASRSGSSTERGGGGSGHGTGVGVVFGEPTGLTAKLWQNSRGAVDLGLSWSFNSFFLIYADYLYHFPGALARSGAPALTPYLGIGGELFFATDRAKTDRNYFANSSNSMGLGVRVPLGIEWLPNAPIGVFVEVVPGMGLIPTTFGFLQAGIGIRYYF
jgi:hypothetical protein